MNCVGVSETVVVTCLPCVATFSHQSPDSDAIKLTGVSKRFHALIGQNSTNHIDRDKTKDLMPMLLRIKGITLMGLVYRQFPEEEIRAIKREMIGIFTINQTQKQKNP